MITSSINRIATIALGLLYRFAMRVFGPLYRFTILLLLLGSAMLPPPAHAEPANQPPQFLIAGSPIRDRATGELLALECTESGPDGCIAFHYLDLTPSRSAGGYVIQVLTSRALDQNELQTMSEDLQHSLELRSGPGADWYFHASFLALVGGAYVTAVSHGAGGKAIGIGMMLLTPVAFTYDVLKDVFVAPFIKLAHFFRANRMKKDLRNMSGKNQMIVLSHSEFGELKSTLVDIIYRII